MPKAIPKILTFLILIVVLYGAISSSSFAAGTAASINGNIISISNTDTITYVNGYYLVGTTWKPYTLSGSPFPGSGVWITNGASASINISADKSAIGAETYILTFGCNLNATNDAWVCGDNNNWQINT